MNDLSSPFASRDAQNNIINNPDIQRPKILRSHRRTKTSKKRLVVSLNFSLPLALMKE